jgi:hypothetical protein
VTESVGFAEGRKSAVVRFVIARLKEASTYRGLMLILTGLGVALRPEVAEAIMACGVAVAGLAGVVLPDTAE